MFVCFMFYEEWRMRYEYLFKSGLQIDNQKE